jgi:hypothetical protein
MRVQGLSAVFAASALAALGSGPLSAATITAINSTITNSADSGTCFLTNNNCDESYVVASNATNALYSTVTQVVNVPPTGSFSFGDSFNQSTNTSTGSNFGPSATYNPSTSSPPWNFQDNILFDTNGAAVQAQVIADLSSVSNLQVRIIALDIPNTSTPFDVTSAANATALLGGNSVVTIQNGWTTLNYVPLNLDYSATMLNTVNAGDYILQIRGEAGAGSSYSGSVNFTPVPLPAALPLLLSGLAGLAAAARRRRACATEGLA